MNKKIIITYLLTLLFFLAATTPTLLILTEKTTDITEVADFGEEEKGKEDIKDIGVKIFYENPHYSNVLVIEAKSNSTTVSSYYQNEFIQLFSPPPEIVL